MALIGYAGFWMLLRSTWLREQIRARTVQEIERLTGGKVELRSFDFDPSLLNANVQGFVLRGTEPSGAPPLIQVERANVQWKIISFFKRDVDVQRIEIINPRVNVIVSQDGKTNWPSPAVPRPPRQGTIVDDLFRLAADQIVITGGEYTYATQRHPFAAKGQNVRIDLAYDFKGPVYRGTLSSDALQFQALRYPAWPVNVTAEYIVERNAVQVTRARIRSGITAIEAQGRIEDYRAPHGTFDVTVKSDASESVRLFSADVGKGAVESEGKFYWNGGSDVKYEGSFRAPSLDVERMQVRVFPIAATGRVVATADRLDIPSFRAQTKDGEVTGHASIRDYRHYTVEANATDVPIQSLESRAGIASFGYSGTVSGLLKIEGVLRGGFRAEGSLFVTPQPGGVPLGGAVQFRYDLEKNLLTATRSHLETSGSRIDFDGTLAQTLRVKFSASRLEEVDPALRAIGIDPPLPVTIPNGSLLFEGTVSGAIESPLIAGQLRGLNVQWNGLKAAAVSSTLVLSPEKLTLTRFSIASNASTLTGAGTLELKRWRAGTDQPFDVRFDGRSLNASDLRQQLSLPWQADGLLNVSGRLQGTIDDPRGEVEVDWFRPGLGGQRLDRLQAALRHDNGVLHLTSLTASRDAAVLKAKATYAHPRADFSSGTVSAEVDVQGLDLATVPAIHELREDAHARVDFSGKGSARVSQRELLLTSAEGKGKISNIEVQGQSYGNLDIRASMQSTKEVHLEASGTLAGAPVKLDSEWRLEQGYPGKAHLAFGRLPFDVFADLRPTRVSAEPWPLTGGFRGMLDFEGPAFQPEQWKAKVVIDELSAIPARRAFGSTPIAREVEVRLDGPAVFTAENRTITVMSARLIGIDTNLSVKGTFSLAERRPWDLQLDGAVNLAGLRSFSPDVIASGVATLQANIRGELANPQVFGSLRLTDAALNVEGIPNGLDKVTGRVLFDRRRATIDERLTAESGGGALALSGFIDFSSAETFYRLQAEANQVRIRYPEGVSTVANGAVNLSGSSERSLLAGTVTVLRSGFTPRTDLGGLLAGAGKGESAPREANRFLANMQLDVRVRTAPETQFTTSLTNDLQAEANLQIRGSAARPVALGRVIVSQGDINFFGNKYTITRGEVGFYNPAKIEPILDMDLETRVRGVAVTVNFTGPVDKLNVSYRSDPPLQPSEIIALLTVGRSPGSATVGSSQSGARGTFLESGANSLLGSALTSPISSQLQRFFGVSRIKIDPTISGLEGTPQARVTVEQQVSRDVTVTFVTNLNRSQQQLVRLEWNLSKEWSLIALRDENGSFGVDFQLRKQVK
jgi:translocation and assembly module TamB